MSAADDGSKDAAHPELFGAAPTKPARKVPKDYREGHRARLRARFWAGGGTAVADYELLELTLFRAIPRRDVKPLAKRIIERFGGYAEALSADPERLREIEGLGEAAIFELKLVAAAAERLAQSRPEVREGLSSWRDVLAYCRAAMAHLPREQFRVLFLNSANGLIADEVLGEGSVDRAPVYPREVMRRAIALDATALILVHNHPSGDPTPSKADIAITRDVIAAAKPLGVTVHDHVIIGATGEASLRALKLI